MRTHRVFPALQPWSWRTELLRELVTGAHLVAARIEPVTRGREPAVFLDLHFSDGTRAITVPLVYVDLAQLDIREADPLLFPHAVSGTVKDAQACEIIDRLLPDLQRRFTDGGFRQEEVILYGDGAAFHAARARGYFGAAPLGISLPRIAAAVYAQRFAFHKHVVAYGDQAAEFASFLKAAAASCEVAGETGSAGDWYGEFASADVDHPCDVAIGGGPPPVTAAVTVRTDGEGGVPVTVAAPLPADVMISFNAADGAAAAAFSVVAAREPFVRAEARIDVPPALGGSAGRIAIVVRPDGLRVPDSDTAEAAALARALRGEGFAADVLNSVDQLEAMVPDLVHLFGVRPGGFARRVADWAADARKPLIVHALYEAPANGGYWGTLVAPFCFGYSGDDRSVSAYLEMLARRAVEVDGIGPNAPYAPPIAGVADAERVLAMADVVLVNSARERAVVEPFRPRRPTFIVPPLPTTLGNGAVKIGALTGTEPFILVHAPIWPEANQLVVARASASVGVPTIFAGAVVDALYAERLREFASEHVILLGDPDAEQIPALYRAAAVVADAAWTTRGHGSLVTAAAFGAALVCSQNRWLALDDAHLWMVDPADVASVARGIGEAWDAAMRSDQRIRTTSEAARERLAPAAAAIVAAYAKIAQAV